MGLRVRKSLALTSAMTHPAHNKLNKRPAAATAAAVLSVDKPPTSQRRAALLKTKAMYSKTRNIAAALLLARKADVCRCGGDRRRRQLTAATQLP